VSLLSDFEDRVGRTVEGGFARMFRSPVQPAEIAKAAGKEADRSRKVGKNKVWAPTLYNVLLSPKDDENLGGFADTLAGELETYLVGYARERSYSLAARPVVRFLIDKELKLGRFEVIGEFFTSEELKAELGPEFFGEAEDGFYDPDAEAAEKPAAPEDVGPLDTGLDAVAVDAIPHTTAPVMPGPKLRADSIPVVRAGALFDAEAEEAEMFGAGAGAGMATVTVTGIEHDVALRGDRMVAGRLATCDICLQDHNASREHAAFIREDTGWSVEDLGSTNGTIVNGKRVDHTELRDGDVIVIGINELIYHEPRG
jgi:hypothetical protein